MALPGIPVQARPMACPEPGAGTGFRRVTSAALSTSHLIFALTGTPEVAGISHPPHASSITPFDLLPPHQGA